MNDINLISATLDDYLLIQNMSRYYVYDISRYCKSWIIPGDGVYESCDYKIYFTDPYHYAFLIKVKNEVAGFVLINKIGSTEDSDWKMDQFFILGKFQGTGVGKNVAWQIFDKFPGTWETAAIPENTSAIGFWQRVINNYSKGNFTQEKKTIGSNKYQMVVFEFKSNSSSLLENITIRAACLEDAESIVNMHIISWQETYQTIIEQDYLDQLPESYNARLEFRKKQLSTANKAVFFVVELAGKIIGFCEAGPSREKEYEGGEIYAIYILEKYKNIGLGQMLWNKTVAYLQQNQLTPYTVLVLQDNIKARKFYEKNGGREIDKIICNIAGKEYLEIRYIFDKIH
jgi:predicted acetyltransferase